MAELVSAGFSSKEIAKRILVAVKTVEIHRHNVLKKLELHNTAALVNYVSKCGVG